MTPRNRILLIILPIAGLFLLVFVIALVHGFLVNSGFISHPGSSGSGNGNTLRFTTFVLKDDPACTTEEVSRMLIPVGWKTDGGMVYDFNCYYPAQVNLRIFDPNSTAGYAIYPSSYFISADMPGYPPGSNYGGSIVAAPLADPFEAIKQIVIPKYRTDLANVTIVETELLPKLAETTLREIPAMPGVEANVQAGRIRFEYTLNGKLIQEDFFAILRQETMQGFELWNVDQVASVWAEKGNLDAIKKMHEVTNRSVRPGMAWFNKYAQFLAWRHQYNMAAINSAGEYSRQLAQTSDEINDAIKQQYENQQAVNDHIAEARSETMRGETPWDAGDGNKVLLPSDYDHAWRNGTGDFVVSTDPLYDPNTDPNFIHSSWTSMEQLQH